MKETRSLRNTITQGSLDKNKLTQEDVAGFIDDIENEILKEELKNRLL